MDGNAARIRHRYRRIRRCSTGTQRHRSFSERALMTTGPKRDPRADHLITPENAALLVIDYQPSQVASVRSTDHQLLLKNVVSTVKTARAFGLPIVHSTISVASGRQKPTVPELAEVLVGNVPIDRTSINSWEDADFVAAVRSTGRRKLIFCALWTEVCMAFPALDALREGFEVYPVVDAIGGTSRSEEHTSELQSPCNLVCRLLLE